MVFVHDFRIIEKDTYLGGLLDVNADGRGEPRESKENKYVTLHEMRYTTRFRCVMFFFFFFLRIIYWFRFSNAAIPENDVGPTRYGWFSFSMEVFLGTSKTYERLLSKHYTYGNHKRCNYCISFGLQCDT